MSIRDFCVVGVWSKVDVETIVCLTLELFKLFDAWLERACDTATFLVCVMSTIRLSSMSASYFSLAATFVYRLYRVSSPRSRICRFYLNNLY